MAKKKKKKQQQYTQVAQNEKQYFESGRARKLPLGKMFMGESHDDSGSNLHLILITREHINGNLAIANFVIDPYSGLLDYGFYDYNVLPEIVENFVKNYNLELYEDYESLRQTIYEANALSRVNGFERRPELSVALKILEEAPAELSYDLSLLNKWMSVVEKEENSSAEDMPLSFKDLPFEEQLDLLIYEPEEVESWNKSDWEGYFSDLKQNRQTECLLNGISPLLYLFEKCILPTGQAPDTALAQAMEKFIRHPVVLTGQPFKKVGEYTLSEKEAKIYLSYYNEINRRDSSTDYWKIINKIRKTSEKFPDNPQFYNLIMVCYQLLEDEEEVYVAAQKTYNKFPEYLFAKIQYIQVLLQRKDFDQIKEVLNGKYLLEDMYPRRNVFHYSEYKNYYLVFIEYLIHSGQYDAGWHFYKAFVEISYEHSAALEDIRLSLGASMGNFVVKWIDLYMETEGSIDELLKYLGV